MSEHMDAHHQLEADLHRLRLLRDLHDPEFSTEAEDAILDDMEALWYTMTLEERTVLEAERAARQGFAEIAVVRIAPSASVDLDEDAYARRGLPVRVSAG